MVYLIEPVAVLDPKCIVVCGIDICGRLSIQPICPPNHCPIH